MICTAEQQFSLEEFEIPRLAPTDILVRNSYSGVSVGTEFAVFRHKLDYGPFPVCTGYQAVGVVEDTGADVSKFKIGDKVYYRRNFLPMELGGQPVTVCSGRARLLRSHTAGCGSRAVARRRGRCHRRPFCHAVGGLQRR